jgi:hypothetical protein
LPTVLAGEPDGVEADDDEGIGLTLFGWNFWAMDSNFRFFSDSREPAGDADGAGVIFGSAASVSGLAGVGMTAAGLVAVGVEVAVATGVGCCAFAAASEARKQANQTKAIFMSQLDILFSQIFNARSPTPVAFGSARLLPA